MNKGKQIAFSAIFSAFAVIIYILNVYIKAFTITLGVISSIAIAMPIILNNNIKASILSFISTSLVIFFIVPYQSLLFILFFGAYPILNFIINKINNKVIVYVLKIIYFAGILSAFYFLAGILINNDLTDKIKEQIILSVYYTVGIIALIVYDIIWNILLKNIRNRLKNIIKL